MPGAPEERLLQVWELTREAWAFFSQGDAERGLHAPPFPCGYREGARGLCGRDTAGALSDRGRAFRSIGLGLAFPGCNFVENPGQLVRFR